MNEMTVKTEHGQWSRYELQIALLDGLFQPQKKMSQSDLKLRQIDSYYDWHHDGQTYPKAIHLRLRAPYNLGIEAETVLLALLYLAEQSGEFQPATMFENIPLLMAPQGQAQTRAVGVVWISRYGLLQTSGMGHNQQSYRQLDKYLEQLSQVWVYYKNSISHWEGSDWFFHYQYNTETETLLAQINWRLAGAVFGRYLKAYIDLRERHQLKTSSSKALHRWLSAYVWPGKTRRLHYVTLLDHVWFDPPRTPGAQRFRLHRLKTDILPDLNNLDQWTIQDRSPVVVVSRKAATVSDNHSHSLSDNHSHRAG